MARGTCSSLPAQRRPGAVERTESCMSSWFWEKPDTLGLSRICIPIHPLHLPQLSVLVEMRIYPACKGHAPKCPSDTQLLHLPSQNTWLRKFFACFSPAYKDTKAQTPFLKTLNSYFFFWCSHYWNQTLSIWKKKWFPFRWSTPEITCGNCLKLGLLEIKVHLNYFTF